MTPTPKSKEMNFYDALKEISRGKKVARVSWNNDDYCLMLDEFLSIHTKGSLFRWSVSAGDMEGVDYIIVK